MVAKVAFLNEPVIAVVKSIAVPPGTCETVNSDELVPNELLLARYTIPRGLVKKKPELATML